MALYAGRHSFGFGSVDRLPLKSNLVNILHEKICLFSMGRPPFQLFPANQSNDLGWIGQNFHQMSKDHQWASLSQSPNIHKIGKFLWKCNEL